MNHTAAARTCHAEPDPSFFDSLGEPFASFGRALLAADDAKRRKHAAEVAGDAEAVRLAELDHERAVAAVYQIKSHEASRLLMAVRWAAELFPGLLVAFTDPAHRTELDVTQSAVVEAEHRLDELEDAVVAVVRGEAVRTWD